MNYFAQGFQQATGRLPTQSDYQAVQERRQRAFNNRNPEPPSNAERALAIASPVIGAGLTAAMPSIMSSLGVGGAAAGTTAAATAGNAGAALAAPNVLGASKVAGTAALKGGAGAAGLGSSLAAAATPAAIIAAAYLSHQQYKAAEGKSAGDVINDWGNPMNWVGGIGGILGSRDFFGTSKTQDQMMRDTYRSRMQDVGLLDDEYMLNGVDLGKDGGFRFEDGRQIFDVVAANEDGSATFDEATGEAVGALNPLGYLLSGGDDKFQGQLTGMLYNSLAEGGEDGVTTAEIRQLYDKMGLDHAGAFETINNLHSQGNISENEALSAQNALNQIYGEEYISPDSAEERASIVQRITNNLYG